MAFTKEQKRERRRALQPAFPRPDGRAPSGCSWVRQDGSEWTAVRNEKRTLERAEKKARKKEKAEREEARKARLARARLTSEHTHPSHTHARHQCAQRTELMV